MESIINLPEMLANIGSDLGGGLLKALSALIVFIVFWIVAKIVSSIIRKICSVVDIDKYAEKLKSIELFAGMSFPVTSWLSKLSYYVIILLGLIASAEAAGLNAVSNSLTSLLKLVPSILVACVIFFVGTYVANLIRSFILTAAESMNLSSGRMISNIVFYFLLVMIGIMSLSQAGINTDIFAENLQIVITIFLAALGLGFALSSRGLMENLIGSFYSKGKFEKGKTISFGNTKGLIVDRDNTSVTLESGGSKTIVPLATLVNQTVEIH